MSISRLTIIICILSFDAFAQSTNWSVDVNLGLSSKISSGNSTTEEIITNLVIENDSVVGYTNEGFALIGGDGIQFEIGVKSKKRSGWYAAYGILVHIESMRFYMPFLAKYSNGSGFPQDDLVRHDESLRYLTSSFGLGYQSVNKRRLNYFVEMNLLIGSGWYSKTVTSHQDYYNTSTGQIVMAIRNEKFSAGVFSSYGIGLRVEFGAIIGLNDKLNLILSPSLISFNYGFAKGSLHETWSRNGVKLEESIISLSRDQYYARTSTTTNLITQDFLSMSFMIGAEYKIF